MVRVRVSEDYEPQLRGVSPDSFDIPQNPAGVPGQRPIHQGQPIIILQDVDVATPGAVYLCERGGLPPTSPLQDYVAALTTQFLHEPDILDAHAFI